MAGALRAYAQLWLARSCANERAGFCGTPGSGKHHGESAETLREVAGQAQSAPLGPGEALSGTQESRLNRRRRREEEAESEGMPLGLMAGTEYEEKETPLEVGDSVLLYSDGLVGAHDPVGEMLGFPRLRRLVAEHAAEEGSLPDLLMDELRSFTGDRWEQEDDITLVTLRRSQP